jgi:hypothetical protein
MGVAMSKCFSRVLVEEEIRPGYRSAEKRENGKRETTPEDEGVAEESKSRLEEGRVDVLYRSTGRTGCKQRRGKKGAEQLG